jgi:hypothetical protein
MSSSIGGTHPTTRYDTMHPKRERLSYSTARGIAFTYATAQHPRLDKKNIFALICCARMLLLQKPRDQSLGRRTNRVIRVTFRMHLKRQRQRQATDAASRRTRSLCSSARCAVLWIRSAVTRESAHPKKIIGTV